MLCLRENLRLILMFTVTTTGKDTIMETDITVGKISTAAQEVKAGAGEALRRKFF